MKKALRVFFIWSVYIQVCYTKKGVKLAKFVLKNYFFAFKNVVKPQISETANRAKFDPPYETEKHRQTWRFNYFYSCDTSTIFLFGRFEK